MSDERPFVVTAQPEGLHHRKLLLILLTALLVVCLSLGIVTVWIGGRLHVRTSIHGHAPDTISRVYRTLIRSTHQTRDLDAREQRDLDSYRWVDKPRGIVRIPIDRAFELMVQREKKGGVPLR